MRPLLLWLRAMACFHDRQLSQYPTTKGMILCSKCGSVWYPDGYYFGRYRELPLRTDIEGDK